MEQKGFSPHPKDLLIPIKKVSIIIPVLQMGWYGGGRSWETKHLVYSDPDKLMPEARFEPGTSGFAAPSLSHYVVFLKPPIKNMGLFQYSPKGWCSFWDGWQPYLYYEVFEIWEAPEPGRPAWNKSSRSNADIPRLQVTLGTGLFSRYLRCHAGSCRRKWPF